MKPENTSSEAQYNYKEFEVIYAGTEALLEDATTKIKQIVHNDDDGITFLNSYFNSKKDDNKNPQPFPPYIEAFQAIDLLKETMVQNFLNNPYLSASLNNDPEQVKKYYIITGISVRIVKNILADLNKNQ